MSLSVTLAMAALFPAAPTTAAEPSRRMLAWMPGEVRCAGKPVPATLWRRPYAGLFYGGDMPQPVTFRFRIDTSGRALSIARDGTRFAMLSDDIGPSLAASRFPTGDALRDCTVTYAPRITAPAETPTPDLISYTLNPTNGSLPQEGWAAIFPAAATCDDEPRPAPLVQAYPDSDRVPGTPGVRDWTMFSYDLDARGRPVKVQVLTGTGNRALDTAGARALRRSRYTGGPRTGCRFPFRKPPAIMPAPAIPETTTLGPLQPPPACAADWVSKPPLRYPDPYRRRSIEGWAVIAFDVAPWGGTGNVRVLASEPAAEFGESAAALIRDARRPASATGITGCVERVRYVMGRPGLDPNAEVASP